MQYNNIIYETDELVIYNEFEKTVLLNKNGNFLLEDDFYGDPQCALIDPNNEWAIIAGDHIAIWKNSELFKIFDSQLKWIHSMRIIGYCKVEVLIDPWSPNSAIWELDITTLEFKKIRDFIKYQNLEYTEDIIW